MRQVLPGRTGLAGAVGLVVDDAVVMLEHIMRRLQEGATTGVHGVLAAAAEMGRPLIGSTSATIIVFLPLAFISGVTGGFFKALALTMVVALVLSLIYARFVIPLAAAHWLRPSDAEAAERAGSTMTRLARRNDRAASRALARPGLFTILVAVGVGLIGWASWNHVPSGFMPQMDEGGFILDYKAKPGAALTDTDRLLREAEKIIVATPEVLSYSRRTGVQLGGGLTEADGDQPDLAGVLGDVAGGEDALLAGLQVMSGGYEPPLVQVHHVFDEIRVWRQADEDKDRPRRQFLGRSCFQVLDHHGTEIAIAFELLDGGAQPHLHLGMAGRFVLEDLAGPNRSRASSTVTLVANLVRNKPSSMRLLPPPITSISFPL